MTGQRIIANSSSGVGLRVSIDHGKRKEDFLNTNIYWFYAAEIYLDGSYYDFELKNPELGSLHVYRKSWKGKGDVDLVAVFPRGSWEFVRMLDGNSELDEVSGFKNPDLDDRHYCPEGCWVQGFKGLPKATQEAHMAYNHKPKK